MLNLQEFVRDIFHEETFLNNTVKRFLAGVRKFCKERMLLNEEASDWLPIFSEAGQ